MLSLLLLLSLAPAQRNAKIPDPDPEVERKTFKVADGFEVNLYAADPLLAKPIHMNFDAKGRLWIASSETYPQIKPGAKANDKIIVLEDTKGKGVADKVTVFADGLLIPTGLEPGDGGVYVANSTDLIHLSASKGDKADTRKVVLSGFGTEDTHHLLHTLRWAHDGRLYMNQSVYIHSHVETPHGPRRLNAGGVWQFHPETMRLEVFARGLWNAWGTHFDRYGQMFLTDGAGFQGPAIGFPGAAYDPVPGLSKTLKGLNTPSPKYCGLEIASGSHLPADWQGNLVTCDFRAHRVVRFNVTRDGSGFRTTLMPDVIKASHPAFRPIDVKMGPDGAIYVADWYNPIIQHGEVDFRDPRRDVTRGRIWRITAKGRPLVKYADPTGESAEKLLARLSSPEGFTRHFARRVLTERKTAEDVKATEAYARELAGAKVADEALQLEVLWTMQSLGKRDARLLDACLAAKNPQVRAAAVRVLSMSGGDAEGTDDKLAVLITDDDPLVRREAVSALWQRPGLKAVETALRALDKPTDTYIDYSLSLLLRDREAEWLPALREGTFAFGDVKRLTFALQAVGSEKVISPLVKLLAENKIPAESRDSVLTLLAAVGGPREASLVIAEAAKAPPAKAAALLAALAESARARNVKPDKGADVVLEFAKTGPADVRSAAVALCGLWKLAEARDTIKALAAEKSVTLALRKAAFDALANFGTDADKSTLGDLAWKGDSVAVKRAALISLASADLGAAASLAPAALMDAKDGVGAGDVVEAFLSRKGGAELLAKALDGKKIPADAATLAVRAVKVSGRPAAGLADALTKAGGLTGAAKVLTAAQMAALVAEVREKGDAVRGEKVFRRADQLCLKCHAVGGVGGQVGPDMTSIGATAQVDYLIESLLQPSKAIKENYHSLMVTTRRGVQHTGIKVKETDTALILRTAEDKDVSVGLKSIEERVQGKVSLMPEGLTDTLTRAELVDLVRFLSELGKGERWSIARKPTARRWQVAQTNGEFYSVLIRKSLSAIAGGEPGVEWEPAYSTVAGTLPTDGLPTFKLAKDEKSLTLVRTQIECAADAKVKLELGSAKGLTLYVAGEPVAVTDGVAEVSIKAGTTTVAIVIDRAAAGGEVRLTFEDTPAAKGAKFTTGR